MAIERYQPLLLGIDRHLTFHAVENPGLKRRRLKSRVGCEVECHEIALTTGIAEHKYVRQYPEQRAPCSVFLLLACCNFRCSSGWLTSLCMRWFSFSRVWRQVGGHQSKEVD